MLHCIPFNPAGRDFVVGDLHGCLGQLEAQLKGIGFDPARDRLFSVGDLVDRGPDSLGVLRLLEAPWFFPVLGNHEDDLLTWLADAEDRREPMEGSELKWIGRLSNDEYAELLVYADKLRALPLAIRVGEGKQGFFVCHADRSRAGTRVDLDLLPDEAMATALRDEDQRSGMLWSRRLRKEMARNKQAGVAVESHRCFDAVEPAIEPGVSITFVGHTVMHKPTLYRSHLFIDCGPLDSDGYLALLDVSAIMEAVK